MAPAKRGTREESTNRPLVATGSGWCGGTGAGRPTGYFADFVAVRRQRVQTSAFTDDPLRVIV